MTEPTDLVVFWGVVLARVLLPLIILRYPLPGILATAVLDGVDQTIFQAFTRLNLAGYQSYDKALDIYYLTIAYIATLRNWSHRFSFHAGKVLFYYRLVGVALFELLQLRWLLLLFPNTFEYFFMFYEAVRARWDPYRLSRRMVLVAIAVLWIGIKLPQEYWIHIAQMDATDFLKETVYGVPATASWMAMLTARPFVTLGLLLAAAVLLAGVWWLTVHKLPPADWSPRFAADPLPVYMDEAVERAALEVDDPVFDWGLLEKVVLVGFVSIIFAQILPDLQTTNVQLVVGVAGIVVVNALLSNWLARRGRSMASAVAQFVVMGMVNAALAMLYDYLLPNVHGTLNLPNTLVFVLLLTLIVTLFDMYYPVYRVRFDATQRQRASRYALRSRRS